MGLTASTGNCYTRPSPFQAVRRSRSPINNRYQAVREPRDTTRINQFIRAPQVRVIDSDGSQIGVRATSEALAIARQRGLDLVEVAPNANPPVCKILPYSKYKYDKEKQDRESRKKQKAGLLKELRFRPNIGQHDLDVKVKQIEEFIDAHDKVRITVVFRGREMQHRDLGFKLLMSIQEKLALKAAVEQAPVPDRNRLVMTLIPKPH
jgi:translation initiation factor IF-3